MNLMFQLLITFASAAGGCLFGIIKTRYDFNRKLLIKQLNLVYTPIYREICFSPINTDQTELLSKIREIIYNNFQYVPDDLFNLILSILNKSKRSDFNLWSTIEWSDFIELIEDQYLNLQKLINFDRKINDPDRRKRIILNKLNAYVPVILMSISIILSVCIPFLSPKINKNENILLLNISVIFICVPVLLITLIYLVRNFRSKDNDDW